MSKIQELRAKRFELYEQCKNYLDSKRDENGQIPADAREAYDKMYNDIQNLSMDIELQEKQARLDAEMNKSAGTPPLMGVGEPKDTAKSPTATNQYKDAFWASIRGRGNTLDIMNALSVGVNTDGGYLVPDEFDKNLVQALEENNVFRGLARTIRTQSGAHMIPVANDTMTAMWLDEGQTITETTTQFSQVQLNAHKLGTAIRISNELLNDSFFDLPGYIAERFGRVMGNTEENAFINGTGVKQPTGILHATAGGTRAVTAASETAVTLDEVIHLKYSLKAPYRTKAKWLCNEDLVYALRTIKDRNDRYIWADSLVEGEPSTLLGSGVITSAYMPTVAAGQEVLAYGDFSYYWIADRQSRTFKRLNELYAMSDQVAFLTTQRVDGKLVLPEAIQLLTMAGTKVSG